MAVLFLEYRFEIALAWPARKAAKGVMLRDQRLIETRTTPLKRQAFAQFVHPERGLCAHHGFQRGLRFLCHASGQRYAAQGLCLLRIRNPDEGDILGAALRSRRKLPPPREHLLTALRRGPNSRAVCSYRGLLVHPLAPSLLATLKPCALPLTGC